MEALAVRAPADSFYRSVHWSPDGQCVLAHRDPNIVECYGRGLELQQTWVLGEAVHAVEWHPYASEDRCFLAAQREAPVRLYGADSSRVRASYTVYDAARDRHTAPLCLAFLPDGQKFVAGSTGQLSVYDVGRPGCPVAGLATQARLPLGLDVRWDDSGLVAVGHASGTITFLDLRSEQAVGSLAGDRKGITALRFGRRDGWALWSAARMSNELHQWDLRRLEEPARCWSRPAMTNQRIGFAVDGNETFIASGSTTGAVHLISLVDGRVREASAHGDVVGGVSMHEDVLATGSGQRHFASLGGDGDGDGDEDEAERGDYSVKTWKVSAAPQ